MIVKFEGERPPDESAWLEVLCEALGEKAGSSWVRFYREPGGWRFDLECRSESGSYGRSSRPSLAPADESVALRVYTLLVESGKPLDPGWRPFAPSPPAAIVRTPALVVVPAASAVAEAAPVPLGEAPPPAAGGHLPAGDSRRRSRSPTPLEPVRETKTESVGPLLPAPVLEPEPPAEPQHRPAPRPPGWRGLRSAIVYLPAVLLVALAGWLARDRLQSRPAPPPVPSPSATVSQEALAAQKRLAELEVVVAQLKEERAQVSPGRRPAAAAPIGARQQASGLPPTQRVEGRAHEILAPTPEPGPTPTPVTTPAATSAPTDVRLPTDLSTDADVTPAPVPAAAAQPPPTSTSVPRGAMADLNDPGLTPPVVVTQTQPRFPPLARARRLSGAVWLNALVDETGAVIDVSLVRVSPRGLDFEGAATRWLRARVYRPATKQGLPVRVWVPVMVEFRYPDR